MRSSKITIIVCAMLMGLMMPALSSAHRSYGHGGYSVQVDIGGPGVVYEGYYGYPYPYRAAYGGFYGTPVVSFGYNGWVRGHGVRHHHRPHLLNRHYQY